MKMSKQVYKIKVACKLLFALSIGFRVVAASTKVSVDGIEVTVALGANAKLSELFVALKQQTKLTKKLENTNALFQGKKTLLANDTKTVLSTLAKNENGVIALLLKKPESNDTDNNQNNTNVNNNSTKTTTNKNNDSPNADIGTKKTIWEKHKIAIIGSSIGGAILLSGVGLIFMNQSKQEKEKI